MKKKDPKSNPVLTLIAISERSGNVRRFQLSRKSVRFLLVFCALAFVGFSAFLMDYIDVRFDNVYLNREHEQTMESNARLSHVGEYQGAQIEALTDRITAIQRDLDRMRDFDSSIRRMTNLNPEAVEEEQTGLGGAAEDPADARSAPEGVVRLRSLEAALVGLETRAERRVTSLESLRRQLTSREGALVSVPSIWPVRGWVSSEFGYRLSPFTGRRAMHHGIDIAARTGTPIIAPANGAVEFVGTNGGYGNTIIVRHGGGLATMYGHLQASLVHEGQMVRRGQKIALLGNTGRSTGPHLHYEIRLNGVPVNPRRYLNR